MKKVLFVIASRGFHPIEYGVPRQILEDEDVKVFTASNSKDKDGHAISSDGSMVKVDLILEDVNVDNYDGIFLIGGPHAMEHLDNEKTYKIVRAADKQLDKLFGAICISPRILAKAGVLDGRKVTGWDKDNKLKEIMSKCNATVVEAGLVVDRNLITADGPDHAQEFGMAILKALYK